MYLCFSVLCLSLSYTHRHTHTQSLPFFATLSIFVLCISSSIFLFLCPSLCISLLSFTLYLSLCFVFISLTFPFHALQFVFLSCRLFLFNAYSLFLCPPILSLSIFTPLPTYLPTYPSKVPLYAFPQTSKKRSYRHQTAFLQTKHDKYLDE